MKCNPNFVLREVYGQVLLMPVHRNGIGNEPIHLNNVAAMIWKKAEDCETIDELLATISDLYELTSDSVEQHAVRQFIDQLIQMTLIK